MVAAIIAASASVLVAVLAYWMNHRGEKIRAIHQAKLEWVNIQLRDLYGPLLILADANETAWKNYKSRYLPEEFRRRSSSLLNEQERRRWRMWVVTVFAPAALQMRDTLVKHGDLIIGDGMPKVVLDYCSHVAALEVLIEEWNSPEGAEELLVHHPGSAFVEYIRASYATLKIAQSKLLRS